MVHHCCVPKCSSRSKTPKAKAEGVTFHSFPRNKVMCQAWLHKIKRDTRKSSRNPVPFVVNVHTKVCSKHFRADDFHVTSERRHIKPTAVPSIFYWVEEPKISRERKRRILPNECSTSTNVKKLQSCEIASNKELCQLTFDEENDVSTLGSEIHHSENPSEIQMDEVSLFDMEVYKVDEPAVIDKKIYVDVLLENDSLKNQIQLLQSQMQDKNNEITLLRTVLDGKKIFSIEYFKNFNDKISYYTGFPSYQLFKIAFDLILPSGNVHDVLGRSSGEELHHVRQTKLTAENMFFLVLVKLRQAFDYKHIADLFCIGEATTCRIFKSWINFLYLRLGSLTIWPHRNILIENSLPEFRENYINVLGSIDCTELYIQTPSSLVRQSQCYSNYKSHTTLKGLLVVDPNGAVIFVSQLFTGSMSDKKMFVESGLVSCIKRKVANGNILNGDILLADKGFDVGDVLEPVKLNVPAFRSSNCPFTASEVKNTRTIAHERIHVERAIGRIKSFKILANDISISHLGNINQIWSVCCLLTNFRYALRKSKTIDD